VLLDSVDDPDVAARCGAPRSCSRPLRRRLAWLRSTPWRERIATLFNQAVAAALLEQIAQIRIRNVAESGASALLLWAG